MNDIFREYAGPVLIAQGALDPLNNAPQRAAQFENIRPGVWVKLMDLGHCPMDEGPQEVAEGVIQWAVERGIVREVGQVGKVGAEVEVGGGVRAGVVSV